MKIDQFNFPNNFTKEKLNNSVKLTVIKSSKFDVFLSELADNKKAFFQNQSLSNKAGSYACEYSDNGDIEKIIFICTNNVSIYSLSSLVKNEFLLNKNVEIDSFDEFSGDELNNLYIGWGLAAYEFNAYKQNQSNKSYPNIYINEKADYKYIKSTIESCCLIRNLVNTPANDLVPEDLADITEAIANKFQAKINIVKGDKFEEEFPLIYAVGKGSDNQPCLMDFSWGDNSNPLITIIGKGITFDTGGLNIKPSQPMYNMKKDMGGAAHALALAWMIMSLNLQLRIRVIIPTAENSISGNSFRPADILKSRKGLTVEVSDTDAEGRLLVADAITLATEKDNPDFMVDFATLTGAARVAVGYDIAALMANSIEIGDMIRDISMTCEDEVWPLPMTDTYKKEMDSSIADISSLGSGRAGATHGGLFLQEFIVNNTDWVHMDIYSWEQNGKAGRPRGGADTGMRAIFKYIKDRFEV